MCCLVENDSVADIASHCHREVAFVPRGCLDIPSPVIFDVNYGKGTLVVTACRVLVAADGQLEFPARVTL